MLFSAFNEEKVTSAQLVALASDARFAASGKHEQPLVGAPVAVVSAAFLVARRENHLGRLGSAVAGDYAESPAKPQVLPDQLTAVTYCLLPVLLPVLGAGVVVLLPLPEPMPLELGEVGLVVLPLELEPEPLVLPEAPLPAVPLDALRASRMHLSRSAPVSPTHLLASLPDAPDAAEPDEPEVVLSLLPEDELPEADGVLVLLPEEPLADGVLVLLPDEPAPALPEVPDALLPEPEPEPED